ncbi:hypothetical protein H7Y29_01365 [Microbacteriaceae bacterium]|nr:hypothetical protein [Candidatus Saccharibacteria bacterium]
MKLQKSLRSIIKIGLVAGILATVLFQGVSATPGVLPSPSTLSLSTSSHDAFAKYQTITYRATVTKPGKLTHIIMTLPAGATVANPRSSSGTVAAYKPGQIIWKPAAPINVVAGSKLGIPVVGINYNQSGNSNLWLVGSDSVGEVLAYARGDFLLNNTSSPCQPTGNSYIRTENAKLGTPKAQWQIDPTAFVPTTLSGFASADSYKCGDVAYFKVDSQLTSFATAKVYRMGYYGGTGAREIWSTADSFLSGKQPAAQVKSSTTTPAYKNMADASNWNNNIAIRIDGRFTPGTYLTKFTDLGGRATYVPFTVRDDTGFKHDFLFQQATTTWQAYNSFGGHAFYTAIPNQASRLSFNRPYSGVAGLGSGEFLQLESGMVYQLEKEGRDVAYWTDTDLHSRATELPSRTRTLILPGHDEYYSAQMRLALDKAINGQGINLVSFGANQIHREIMYNAGNRTFDVKGAYSLTSGTQYKNTTFRVSGGSKHEQAILGAQYGCGGHGDVTTNNSWIWHGISTGVGTKIGGFINGEADYQNVLERAYGLGTPVPVPIGNTKLQANIPLQLCRIGGEAKIADIVARTTPTGSRVFSGSSFAYGCFITKSCLSTWKEGPRINPTSEPIAKFAPLSISDTDSADAAIVVNNVLYWAQTGLHQ